MISNVIEHTGRAPRPRKRSLSRSMYDAIAAAGGTATYKEIKELLPATDDADRWPARVTQKHLAHNLHNMVHAGYLVKSVDGERRRTYFKIAPFDYYQARRAERVKRDARRSAKKPWDDRIEAALTRRSAVAPSRTWNIPKPSRETVARVGLFVTGVLVGWASLVLWLTQ